MQGVSCYVSEHAIAHRISKRFPAMRREADDRGERAPISPPETGHHIIELGGDIASAGRNSTRRPLYDLARETCATPDLFQSLADEFTPAL